MSQTLWSAVDAYLCTMLVPEDQALTSALEAARAAGLPSIAVSATQGKLLHLLARVQGASRILELGTLGGYSTIWLARALPPGGRLISLELDPKHAEVARKNIAFAGLSEQVELRVGKALDSLPALASEALPPFDLVFIDADKANIPAYFDWALRLARPGTLILVDNIIRDGNVIDRESTDPNIQGVRRFNERIAANPRVSATAIQTVGSKGYDGFAMVLVESVAK